MNKRIINKIFSMPPKEIMQKIAVRIKNRVVYYRNEFKYKIDYIKFRLTNHGFHSDIVLSALYTHFKGNDRKRYYFIDPSRYLCERKTKGELPVPPPEIKDILPYKN